MSQADRRPSEPAKDNTSFVVRAGLLVLLALGVATVFGQTLMGALFPPTEPPGATPGEGAAPAPSRR